MSKQIVAFGLFALMLGFLGSGICTVNAAESEMQDEAAKFEAEANALAAREMSTGWIDDISEEQIVIDDTEYLFTEGTTFSSGRDSLGRGGFVAFELGQDNYVAQIEVTIPSRSDIDTRRGEQFTRTPEEPEEQQTKDASQPRLENGVWVN